MEDIQKKAGWVAGNLLNDDPKGSSLTAAETPYAEDDAATGLLERLRDREYFERRSLEYSSYDTGRGWDRFNVSLARKRKFRLAILKYAASLLLLVTIPLVWHLTRSAPGPAPILTEITPGTSKATLLLEDGNQLALGSPDSSGPEVFYYSGHFAVSDGSSINYNNGEANASKIQNHTIITPRGGEYRVTLPDGTRVWLNADSRITFPNAFTGDERLVTLSGEAYFEVVPDTKKPFTVSTPRMDVRVIGTSFNLSSYAGEDTHATLVEGSVEVFAGGDGITIRPGEQALLTVSGLGKRRVDIRRYTSWKDNIFAYRDTSLQDVFRELERWYDVEFALQSPGIQDILFTANLPKYENIDKVLDIINYVTGTEYGIYGRTVTVK